MNKSKFKEYFDAASVTQPIHIIGCGSIGSHLAELFARQGVKEMHLWDMDDVSAHNISNQMFKISDVGRKKVIACLDMVAEINDEATIKIHMEGWKGEQLSGYIFMCVDNIELRKQIVLTNRFVPGVIAFFDCRTRLTDSQVYAAERTNGTQVKALLESMNFTHDEVKAEVPVSACGVELNVVDLIKITTSICFAIFRKYVKEGVMKTAALIDVSELLIDVV